MLVRKATGSPEIIVELHHRAILIVPEDAETAGTRSPELSKAPLALLHGSTDEAAKGART